MLVRKIARGAVLALALAAGALPATARAQPVLDWSQPEPVAQRSGSLLTGAGGISCASASLCVAVGEEGRFLYTTEPTGGIDAWQETQVTDPGPADLTAVSCPGEKFCAAVDKAGNVFLSQDPEQGAWIKIAIGTGHPLTDVSCSSGSFCVAGDEGGNVFVSEDPTGGAGAWEATQLDAEEEVRSISCAGLSLCVAVTKEDTFTSTDPGAGAWSATGLDEFIDVSCPSASFCAATGYDGVFVSGEPAGGESTWIESPGSPIGMNHVSCPTDTFCAALDFGARIFTSTDPAGAEPSWQRVALLPPSDFAAGLSCPSDGFCAALLDSGAVLTSTDPPGGAGAWDYTATDGWDPVLTSASCPTASLCLVAGPRGTLYASTAPTVAGSWSGERITEGGIEEVRCASVGWCVARAYNRTLLYSTNPTGGAAAWSSVSMPFATSLACPTESFCAAVDGGGEVLTSTDPLGGADAWSATDLELPEWRLGPNELKKISCPSESFCAVGGDVGTVVVSDDPTGGKAAWSPTFVGNPEDFHNGAGPNIDGLDCPSASFCAATMWSGTISTSDEPLGGSSAWNFEGTDGAFFRAVSCGAGGDLCVAVSRLGFALSSFDASSAEPTWSPPEAFAHEGLEDVACEPGGSFCLVVDDQGYVTLGVVGEAGNGGGPPFPIAMPPAQAPPVSDPRPRPCKVKKKAGKRAGKIGIGAAVALSSGGKRSRSRCARPR